MVLNFLVGIFYCQRRAGGAKQPVQLKSMEIFPVTSMKPSMGTRSVKMTGSGPWRILRQAALNWVWNQ